MKFDKMILDGRHLLWRTSDAFSNLSTKIGGEEMSIGGVYGFINISSRIFEKWRAPVCVAWEGEGVNFRYKLYPGYKNRDKPDPQRIEISRELNRQESILKGILTAIGVTQYYGVDCEADDVIGNLSVNSSGRVAIYSGDSDLRQLVVPNSVWTVSPAFGKNPEKVYGIDEVFQKHGVFPSQIADLKALSGDSSDGIPGVPSIGPKTAATLLSHYVTLKKVFEGAAKNEDWPTAQRYRVLVLKHAREVALYKKLTKIKVNCELKEIPPSQNRNKVVAYFKKFRFASFLENFQLQDILNMAG